MAIRHHVVAAWGHHPDNGVQQLGTLVQPPNASNHSNVRRHLVIGEDPTELIGDGHSAAHLAAVESDHEGIVEEARGIGLRVLPIPRVKDGGVQSLEVSGSLCIGHAGENSALREDR